MDDQVMAGISSSVNWGAMRQLRGRLPGPGRGNRAASSRSRPRPEQLSGRSRPPRKSRAAVAGAAAAAAAIVQQPPPDPDPSAGAFFDVDNTLMRGASIYYFARGLAARKMFGPRDLARMAWGQMSFRVRGAENSDHIDAAREAALAFVAGHKVADIVTLSRGDLRREHGRPDLGGHQGTRAAPPPGGPAGMARHRHAGGAGQHHLATARADRRARHGRGVRGRPVHRTARRRAAAR